MEIRLDQMIRSLATGLDAVEGDFLGASTYHGARIATLCSAMGRHMGFTDDELLTVSCCALLHDNALTEYILSERPGSAQEFNMRCHCVIGQENAENLPFPSDMEHFILYHHERADGMGPFRADGNTMPLGAQMIAITDMIDSQLHLQRYRNEDLPGLYEYVRARTGTQFTQVASDAFLAIMDEEMLEALQDENIKETVAASMPTWTADIKGQEMLDICSFVRKIIDYKSEFTKHHSTQVANIVWHMAKLYELDDETCAQLYFASSLHDLGKLFVPTEILEKPGPLTDEEFDIMKSHVQWTQDLLESVEGLEGIAQWASYHHEKLDGSGYPRGASGDEQDICARLITCADIYQAVGDKRPYHDARTHDETEVIIEEMIAVGQLDERIARDMARMTRQWPIGQVPTPDAI